MKVIVVGSGLAGLTAAYVSYFNNNEVILLEKNEKIGGNSLKATSGINFLGKNDSTTLFYQDTIRSGEYNNEQLVQLLINKSIDAREFLESLGLRFDKVFNGGGHSVPRTHSISGDPRKNIGNILVNTLYDKIKQTNILVKTNIRVTDINIQEGKVTGVVTSQGFMSCDYVIFATGGYGCSPELLGKYGGIPTTNDITTSGDGQLICIKNGINVTNLEDIQIHPTAFVDTSNITNKFKFLAPEALRGLGGILIDKSGNRFTNELDTRDKVTHNIFYNCQHIFEDPTVLLVCGDNEVKKFGPTSSFYVHKKLLEKHENVNSIAKKYDIPIQSLTKTLQIKQKPYYVALVTPAVHYTMGGVEINSHTEVISYGGQPIKGFFACGEVTTGVHGKNRLVGNSLLECVVFGMIAGKKT